MPSCARAAPLQVLERRIRREARSASHGKGAGISGGGVRRGGEDESARAESSSKRSASRTFKASMCRLATGVRQRSVAPIGLLKPRLTAKPPTLYADTSRSGSSTLYRCITKMLALRLISSRSHRSRALAFRVWFTHQSWRDACRRPQGRRSRTCGQPRGGQRCRRVDRTLQTVGDAFALGGGAVAVYFRRCRQSLALLRTFPRRRGRRLPRPSCHP